MFFLSIRLHCLCISRYELLIFCQRCLIWMFLGLASQNLTVCYLLLAYGRIYERAEITVVIVDLFFSKGRPIDISVHVIFQIFSNRFQKSVIASVKGHNTLCCRKRLTSRIGYVKGTSHPTLTNRTYFEQVRGKQLQYIVSLAWLVPGKLYHCNLNAQQLLDFFEQIQSFGLISND